MCIDTPIAFMNTHFSNSVFPSHKEAHKTDVKGEHFLSLWKNNLNSGFWSLHKVTCGPSCTAQAAQVTRPKSTDPMVPLHPLPSPPYGPDGIKSWGLVSFQSRYLCTGQNDLSPWIQGTSILPTKSNDG